MCFSYIIYYVFHLPHVNTDTFWLHIRVFGNWTRKLRRICEGKLSSHQVTDYRNCLETRINLADMTPHKALPSTNGQINEGFNIQDEYPNGGMCGVRRSSSDSNVMVIELDDTNNNDAADATPKLNGVTGMK